MRPQILFPLFTDLAELRGIGARTGKLLGRLDISRPIDLLWHLPTGVILRRPRAAIREAAAGELVVLTLSVVRHRPGQNRRAPYRIQCTDGQDSLDLVYFHAKPDWLEKLAPAGTTRVITGRIEHFRDTAQIVHPDHVLDPAAARTLKLAEPQYPLTAGLNGRTLTKARDQVLAMLPELPDWLAALTERPSDWPSWQAAIRQVHAPVVPAAVDPGTPARRRLAFDELLANQIALMLMRNSLKAGPGRSFAGDGALAARLAPHLPFALTGAQGRARDEIIADLGSSRRMLRLLQGDVGSGKTVVAFLAMLCVVECGSQAAILAPTEILARQHLDTIAPLALKLGLDCRLLTARDKGAARSGILERLASGRLPLIVGTHALLQADVRFRDLGLVVIDEQHRFGVDQRLALTKKGAAVDVLAMTATPIPRTLQLAAFGDLDVSVIDERPAGRIPVRTAVLSAERIAALVDRIAGQRETGGQVFWVCPLVEDSEELPGLISATRRYEALREVFGDGVGLIHGRMRPAEKDRVMERFVAGDIFLLVSTTVIEVGVDVPQASIIVIEHAERFGLAQLHQLRGRVGRGQRASSCALLYAPPLGDIARQRLAVLRETDDGFAIAEQDLKLRGGGEVLGTRQSGLPECRLIAWDRHADLLPLAHRLAQTIVAEDPDLSTNMGTAVRTLLYLFDRDAAVRYMRSG